MNDNKQNDIAEKIEGLETPESIGWDEYPLDSVFVRKEQRTVSEVVKRIKNDRFILNPDFQRDFIWSVKKQSRLIESCLMRIPLPVFYLAEAEDGRIIVVDGLQRLTTFVRYLNNDFALSKLGDGREDAPQENSLIGKRYRELPLNLQERIEDTQLTLFILDPKAPQRTKLDIFERVNSGEPLARQQMRNCLFNGPATRWLAKTAKSKAFLDATGSSLNPKIMRDREAINRFCAFHLLGTDEYRGDMDDFLARTLEKMNCLNEQELEDLSKSFARSMQANYTLFGKHSFRKSLFENRPNTARSVINIALFDVCSALFVDMENELTKENINFLRTVLNKLLTIETFVEAITIGTNGRRQVMIRFEMLRMAIKKVAK